VPNIKFIGFKLYKFYIIHINNNYGEYY